MAKRAMTDEAKAVKAQAILNKAEEIFLTIDYDKIKMSDLAKAMGMSNGILFVYFKTKETLFMSLLWREYEKRLDCLIESAQNARFESYDDIKQLIINELEQLVDTNPLYIRLEAMRSIIFEKNTDLEIMFNMKKRLYERTLELTSIISNCGILTQSQLAEILNMEASIITGCKLNSDLPPAVIEIIDKVGMESFKPDFKKDVMNAVSCYLEGFGKKIIE